MADILTELRGLFGDDAVLDPAEVAARAAAIGIRRRCTRRRSSDRARRAEVGKVLALCDARGQTVVTHGGLTGVVAGATTGPGRRGPLAGAA